MTVFYFDCHALNTSIFSCLGVRTEELTQHLQFVRTQEYKTHNAPNEQEQQEPRITLMNNPRATTQTQVTVTQEPQLTDSHALPANAPR